MGAVQIAGLDKLIYKLESNKNLTKVKEVVQKNGRDMQNKMERHANFHGHYEWERGKGKVFKAPTGTTKRSITGFGFNGGLGYEAQPGTHYSPYLEYGTRKMEAQPFVKPAFNEQKEQFISDMKKVVGD